MRLAPLISTLLLLLRLVHSATGPGYLGCFVDNYPTSRDLPVQATLSSPVTIESCRYYCGLRLYSYAAVQFSTECFCGNSYGSFGPAPSDSECNSPCAGNSGQTCGGDNRNSVYSADAGYLGCFADDSTARDFPVRIYVWNGQTINDCKGACRDNGYTYAGLQYGEECWCGNNYGSYGQVSNSECNVNCGGDSSQKCGAGYRNSVFSVDVPAYPFSTSVGVCKAVLVVDSYIRNALSWLSPAQIRARYAQYWADVDSFYQNKMGLRMPLAYLHVESGSFSSAIDAGQLLTDFNNAIANGVFGGAIPNDACVYHLLTGRQPPGIGGLAFVATACGGANKGLSVDGSGQESADLVIRRMVHEVGHNLNGNHPDHYINANPSYGCSTNEDRGPLRILRAIREEKGRRGEGEEGAPRIAYCGLEGLDTENESEHQKRVPSPLRYSFLHPDTFISDCATNAITRSLSAFPCMWNTNPTSPRVTWYNDINYGGEARNIDAHRGTGSSVCYNMASFSNRATSYSFSGTSGITVFTIDDCRGAGTSFTTSPNPFVGNNLNDEIESFKFF